MLLPGVSQLVFYNDHEDKPHGHPQCKNIGNIDNCTGVRDKSSAGENCHPEQRVANLFRASGISNNAEAHDQGKNCDYVDHLKLLEKKEPPPAWG